MRITRRGLFGTAAAFLASCFGVRRGECKWKGEDVEDKGWLRAKWMGFDGDGSCAAVSGTRAFSGEGHFAGMVDAVELLKTEFKILGLLESHRICVTRDVLPVGDDGMEVVTISVRRKKKGEA